jgi:transcriptional regulator with XRE-family HTH domain
MEIDDISDRIKLIMEEVNLSYSAFAAEIGIQQSTLSHIIKKRNKASLDVVTKINNKFPQFNLYWLLYGQGEMLNNKKVVVSSQPIAYRNENEPGLFDVNRENPDKVQALPNFRTENAYPPPTDSAKEVIRQEIKFVEKPAKKITEIRIFFDDNTFQIFTCEK